MGERCPPQEARTQQKEAEHGREGRGSSRGCQTQLGPHTALGKGPFLPPGSDSPPLPGPARETLADTGSLPSQSRTKKGCVHSTKKSKPRALCSHRTHFLVWEHGDGDAKAPRATPSCLSMVKFLAQGLVACWCSLDIVLVAVVTKPGSSAVCSPRPPSECHLHASPARTLALAPGQWASRKTHQGTCQRGGRTEAGLLLP